MKKYRFPALNRILTVKIGTKYIWEKRVKHQAMLVHLLEEVYDIKLNFQAFSFYPNLVYFGMPLSFDRRYTASAKPLWKKIANSFNKNRWSVFAANEHVGPEIKMTEQFENFEDVGFGYTQLLLSELVLMDLNKPSLWCG